jgi:hypothetical protein
MFETFSLSFEKERDAMDVFESVKELTVCSEHPNYLVWVALIVTFLDSVNQLYAFFYTPSPPFDATSGWSIYSPREEFGRMGVGTRTKAWRFTDINKDYAVSIRLSLLTHAVCKEHFKVLAYLSFTTGHSDSHQ